MRIPRMDIGNTGCVGCMVKAIPIILAFLVGVYWAANQYYQQPWHHFYLPDWVKVALGGVAVYIIMTSVMMLTTVSNTAAIWAAGLGGKRQSQDVHLETRERIQELAGVQRVESGVINTLLREKNDLRRELAQQERRALPEPEEQPMVRFDPAVIDRMRDAEEADIVDSVYREER